MRIASRNLRKSIKKKNMKYFTKDFIIFFSELAKNNNKDWFHENKKRYENEVKIPFEKLVTDLIEQVNNHEKIEWQAKDCILRINRDIRFAKDKTPYNLHRTAFISKGGRKDKSIPGLFIRLSPELVGVMGGCFGPDKNQLASIRNGIIKNGNAIHKLINAKAFKSTFGEIKGDQMKRVPKELQAAAALESLILNKQYYYVVERKPSLIYSDNLLEAIMTDYLAMKPMNDYLTKLISK